VSALAGRRLYLCTPDRPDLARFLRECIGGGVDLVQLRDKDLDDRRLIERARLALEVCWEAGVPLVVNDRADLALAAGADGVHLGQDDAPVSLARRILAPSALVGLSTHSEAELEQAQGADCDYVSVGPVVPTPTKPGRPGTGLGLVSAAAARSAKPFFVTGGVAPDTVPGLVRAGARRFVVVRYLTQADRPGHRAAELRRVIDEELSRAA